MLLFDVDCATECAGLMNINVAWLKHNNNYFIVIIIKNYKGELNFLVTHPDRSAERKIKR